MALPIPYGVFNSTVDLMATSLAEVGASVGELLEVGGLDGMESAMAQNLWNDSTPQGKEMRWPAEEDGLEVDPSDSEVLVQRYALAVIFYATGGETWIDKSHFLSKMSVCDWNELDEDDYAFRTYLGTNCTDGNAEVYTLNLGKFLKNKEP